MATLDDLYTFYCRRRGCKPNSSFSRFLQEEYERRGQHRILDTVDLSSNYVGKKGAIPIFDLVKNVKTIKKLNASNNMLEHEQLDHLVYCLALHPSIEEVDVSKNCLHDGSVSHILKLLEVNRGITTLHVAGNDFTSSSLALIEDYLSKNKEHKLITAADVITPDTGRSFRARIENSLEEENSGGYVYFSTWWKNPQYVMHVSQKSRIRMVMDVHDGKEAKQSGFVVFQTDGARKVIEKKHMIAESNISHSHCFLEIQVEENMVYTIMPFTFHPERGMSFTLRVEVCRESTPGEEGWVTLEPLDPALDWCVYSTIGEWTRHSAGGSSAHHSWCRNPMLHVQYAGSLQPYRMASSSMIMVILTKSVDPDDNDERCIGFDVVSSDPAGENTPPITSSKEFVKCIYPHEKSVSVCAQFNAPCTALDLFIVPSTLNPGELGNYSLTLFSTVPLTITTSEFPHRWNYRAIHGLWDGENCGGSRENSLSWKNNPSVSIHFDPEDEPHGITVFLEGSKGLPVMKGDIVDSDTQPQQDQASRENANEDPEKSCELSPQELQEKADLADFWRRHQSHGMEICVSIIETKPPFYPLMHTSDFSDTVAYLSLPTLEGEFYLFAGTRHAGQLGSYTMHVFSVSPFVVDGPITLIQRERQSQMAQYNHENVSRKTQLSVRSRPGIDAPEDVIKVRDEILRKCMATGEKFTDRDFPRGASSLWLDPAMKPPMDFPKLIHWKRPTELHDNIIFLSTWRSDCPFPYSKREWFASVAYAISSKPTWLQVISMGYNVNEGIAQFRFFKDGNWKVVTIDDYLPVDNTMELCMGKSSRNNTDMFFPLLEKAYAKLHRCYETLERKVTPDLSIVEMMCQGILDLSGCISVSYPVNREERVNHGEQEELWSLLKPAVNPEVLVTLLLREESYGASEKRNLGIIPDHLYPVLDARFVEGQRLVKLRHWGQMSEVNWTGKWCAGSSNWTSVLREILEFDESDTETFWLGFDEILYYFTDLITTSSEIHNDWISTSFSESATGSANFLQEGLQFSLQLSEFPKGVDELQVLVGVHQLDPRTTITRDKHALATYRTSIALAIVATSDNTVWLKEVEEKDVVKHIIPPRRRENIFPVTVTRDCVSGNRMLTLIVFRDVQTSSKPKFLLSAWSENCGVKLIPVKKDETTQISGKWPEERPIGPPTSLSWRDCPQYFVYPSESTLVSFSLRQEVPVHETAKSIGFTVHRAVSCRSFLEYDPETVDLKVEASPSSCVSGAVRLLGMRERRGMPYIIVPFCTEPHPNEVFHIEAVANRAVKLCTIDSRLDWHRETLHVSFSLSDGSVGGSPHFSSWRSSPQFALTFPIGGQGRLYLVCTNDNPKDTLTELGMMLLHGDSEWEHGQRRKLVIGPTDMIVRSEESIGSVTMECQIDVQPGSTLILSVFSSMPYREGDVTVAIYSAAALEVEPVKEWKHVAAVDGSWNLGFTAGGGSEVNSSWINNPFVALNTFRRTRLVALLLQYPRGPDKPLVKRAGNKKAFLPPIVMNPHNRMDIALDLNIQDEKLTPIASTPYTRNSEVTLVTSVPPAESLPFLFVPHTKDPQGNGEFKLFVYADSKIELLPVGNPRIPYV